MDLHLLNLAMVRKLERRLHMSNPCGSLAGYGIEDLSKTEIAQVQREAFVAFADLVEESCQSPYGWNKLKAAIQSTIEQIDKTGHPVNLSPTKKRQRAGDVPPNKP